MLTKIHSILASESCCRISRRYTSYTRCGVTHPIFRLNLGQSRSPLLVQCCSIVDDAEQHYSQHLPRASYQFWYTRKVKLKNIHHSDVKTKQIGCHTSVYTTHWTVNQCCFNVYSTCLTMAQEQPNVGSLSLGESAVYFAAALRHCYAGDAPLRRQKGHY